MEHRQQSWGQELLKLGFDYEFITRLQAYYQFTDLSVALEYAMKNSEGAWLHLFIPGGQNPESCEICHDNFASHTPAEMKHVAQRTSYERKSGDARLSGSANVVCRKSYGEREWPVWFEQAKLEAHLSCGHEVCKLCLIEYLTEKISIRDVLNISCQEFQCYCEFSEPVIKNLVSDQVFRKYQLFYRNARFDLDPSSRWCPTPDCDTILTGSSQDPKLICTKCDSVTCFLCNEPWHEGISCTVASNDNFNVWANGKDIQNCPQCQRVIQKDEGCNHMTCIAWNYEWCWLWRWPWTPNHLTRCPVYDWGPDPMLQEQESENRSKKIIWIILLIVFFPLVLVFYPAFYCGQKSAEIIFMHSGANLWIYGTLMFTCFLWTPFIYIYFFCAFWVLLLGLIVTKCKKKPEQEEMLNIDIGQEFLEEDQQAGNEDP